MLSYTAGFVLALTSASLMILAIILAYYDEMFWSSQFTKQYNVGFPLVANGAIWGNLVLLSAALYVIGKYWWQWDGIEVILAFVIGLAISFALFYFVYLQGKFPDALAGGGRPLSSAGWVVALYSGIAYAAIGMFYFRASATTQDVLLVSGFLALYIPIANHAVLGWLNSWFSWPWCPRIFAEEANPLRFIIGGEVVVAVATIVKLA